ncbi:hypothetical protein [Deinococcus ruber]|uniref:Uncharacterized protein n=1 Tax=Deinococcus ruber TaxID=1848197 RepID=A0A918F774_9DEIO|nr:hypothetical protein [Deinococcus ruber]GGR15531.1 hypothetical protein GCM10008957_30340 [Deinococcus ruber]
MDDLPFPQYRKGVPKAGLDSLTHWFMALSLAAFVYLLLQMVLGSGPWTQLLSGAAAFGTFRFIAVPAVRYVFNRLPPNYLDHVRQTTFFRGGLAARADPDPLPLVVD